MNKGAFLLLLFGNLIIGSHSEQSTQDQQCQDIVLPFICENNDCIKRRDFCDNVKNCADGSDELDYDMQIHNNSGGVACVHRRLPEAARNKTCFLPKDYLCDHEVDCVGGVDECGCHSTFSCDNGDCQLRVQFCDGVNDCSDGSDEKKYNRRTGGFQCQVKKKHNTLSCVLPEVHICDGASECQWGTDECFCDFSSGTKKGVPINNAYSNEKCFRCLDGTLVIPDTRVCDGIVDCKDLSDECLCEHEGRISNKTAELCDNVCMSRECGCSGQLRCIPREVTGNDDKICIKPEQICDDNYDCENGYDEKFCALNEEFFECLDKSKKVRKIATCDGIEDCPDGSDEQGCHRDKYICNMYKTSSCYNKGINKSEPFPPLNRTKIEGCYRRYRYDWPFYAEACDGVPHCVDSDDECDDTCPGPKPAFCNFTQICPNSGSYIIGYEVCDGQPTCNDTAPHTSEDEWGCPGRFYCKNYGETRLPIHIPEEHRCDGKAECDDQSDELECSNETHFYCNDQGSTLFIPRALRCNRRKDCKDGLDECDNCGTDPFSSDEKLIQSRVLIVFLWIIAIVATLGNTINIVHQSICIYKIERGSRSVALKNRVLVLNLASADLLIGIYLLALGIKDNLVEKYCLLDQEWRSSSTCSGLGVIALVGTEASVMILLIMTTYRLHLAYHPFKKEGLRTVLAALAAAWVIAIILAVVPLSFSAKDYFLSCVWFRSHRYLGYACKSEISDFTRKLVAFDGPEKLFSNAVENMSEYTWDAMLAAQKVLNESYYPERYYGYYSAHSVCLPRLFPDKEEDRSWGYSLFIVLLNFFALAYILFSYIAIYKRTTSNKISSHRENRAHALQRKITRIVLTDFCCWMPICIMAFIRVAGVEVGDTAYAATAIILLPINSAMNPFLYSSLLDVIWKYLRPARERMSDSVIGRTMATGNKNGDKRVNSVTSVTAIPPSPVEKVDAIATKLTTEGSPYKIIADGSLNNSTTPDSPEKTNEQVPTMESRL